MDLYGTIGMLQCPVDKDVLDRHVTLYVAL